MIDRKLLSLVNQALGIEFTRGYPDDIDTRVIVQKVLYLLTHGARAPRVNLPYNWSFYLRGPYSSEIAHALYHASDVLGEEASAWAAPGVCLTQEEDQAILSFKALKGHIENDVSLARIPKDKLYEAMTTLVYVAGLKRRDILDAFKSFKPKLADSLQSEQLASLVKKLKQHGYIAE